MTDQHHLTPPPNPPSMKRTALLRLKVLEEDLSKCGKEWDLSQIRLALEQLND